MESEENSRLFSQDENNNDSNENSKKENSMTENQNSSKHEINNNDNKNVKDEIEVELVLKSDKNNNDLIKNIPSKNNLLEEKTKNKELILPKIENSIKPTKETNLNFISCKEGTSEDNTINNNEKEKKNISNKATSINKNTEKESSNNIYKNKHFSKSEKEEKVIKNFNRLKKALMLACVEIENNLNKIYYPEKTEEMMNISHVNITKSTNFSKQNNDLTEEQKQKENENYKKIKIYKSKIKSLQNQLIIELKVNKADELENLYKEKKSQLEALKKENMILTNANTERDKSEINNQKLKKEALLSMNEKIRIIKEETKIKKDYCRNLIETIKAQNTKINELENKCDLINQNIDYYKKKEAQKIKNQKVEDLSNNDKNDEEIIDLDKLKKDFEENYSIIKEKEEKLKLKVKEQNNKKKDISKHNEQLSDNITNILIELKDKTSQIISYENKIKIKELQIYDKINKKNNNLSEKKPFHIAPINSNNKKTKKIFDYQKYLKEYENGINKIKNRLYTSADSNIKPKTLNEIEKLKSDIQQVIKKTELDEKIKKIIIDLKLNSYNKNINNNNNEEEDALQQFLKKNEEINYKDRYNFYVTEGANLPVPLKAENINNNLYSNY